MWTLQRPNDTSLTFYWGFIELQHSNYCKNPNKSVCFSVFWYLENGVSYEDRPKNLGGIGVNSRSRYRNGLNTPDQALSKSKRGGGATRRRLLQRNLFYETLEPRQMLAVLGTDSSTTVAVQSGNEGELPPIPIVQRTTDEIELVDELTEEFLGNSFELDFYRNNAYAAGLTGNYTFLVMNPAGNPDAEAPLWVYLHGGGVGYYDDTGTYVAVKNQTEDTWNHEETFTGLWENHVLAKTFNENTGQPIDSTLKRRIDEGYRVMVVSLSDHDLYSGLGTSYTNSPNPGAEVNGLQATMAAIDYAVANYATTHVWAHGTSAGSIGVWSLASSYTAEGTPLTGIVADSWIVTPRLYITADAFTGEPGYPFGAGFDVDGVTDKVGFYTDPDNRSEPEAQISDRDFREVPSLFISGNDDPFFGGNQAPLAEAVAEGLTNGQWYHDGLKQAIDNQPNSPHEYHNFFGYGHVPTNREGPVNDTVDEFLSKILTGNPAPPEWSIATTSPTIAEDALANEMLILSLAGTVGEGDQAQVRLDMQDITTSPGDYQDVGVIITQAVDAYNGPGTLAFSNGVRTYKGGVGGSSMNDLSVPILLVNDDLVEENESFVVSLLDMTGDPIGQSQTITIIDDDRSESVWTNLSNRFDVNNDGIITPIDVLNVINYLHVNGSAELPDSRNEGQPFYDVSKDGWISPVDAIQIINEINGFNYTVTIGVQATAANGDVMSEVEVGSIFYLTLTAEDHRDDAKGVYAAYADAYYDPNLIAVVGAPQFIDPYINVKHSDLGTTGLIDEWGAVAGGEPTGSGTNVVSRVPLRAIAAGQVLFGAAAVDDQILRAIAVYGSDDAVPTSEINYQAFNLKITDGEGEDAEGEAYFAEPLEFTVESNNIQAPAWLTPLLIDDVLRTNTESNWLDSRNGLASELESELNSGEDWLETIDDWFARDEEAA